MKLDKKIFILLVLAASFTFSTLGFAQMGGEGNPPNVPPQLPPPPSGVEDLRTPTPLPPDVVPPATEEGVTGTGTEGVETGGTEVKSDLQGPLAAGEQVYLNVQDADIKDVIKQISKATGRNFIIDDKIRGKVTIISERPMTGEEAYQTFLSALEVAGYTTVKGPANVIKVVALKDAAKSPIPTHVDSTPYTDSFVTRLISLENISALDMSNAIKDLVSRDGNLFAYPATNTLIMTDSGSNIDRIMKIVKELDQEGPQQVMEIIPVRNALATDVAKMVQDLFEKGDTKGGAAATRKRGAISPEELAEVSRIIPDERTNSIIVFASKRAIENVKAIISKLDSRLSPDDEGRIHVYYLKHAKAKDLAETLNSLTSAAAGTKTAKATGGGTDIAVAKFEGGVKITADEATNALLITALAKDFHTLVDKVISKLDIPRRQVYFEAVVMEMSLSKGAQYGVSGYGGAGGGSTIGFGETMGGPSLLGGIIGQAATSGTGAWPALLGGLVSSRTTNITYVGADGTSSTLTVPAFSAFLSALAQRGEANVVATPNLLTLDNEEATMHVLSKEPTPGSTTFGASGVTTATSIDYKEAGLEMKIKPQITEGDMVLLEIEQKLSGFTTPTYSTTLQAPAMKERKVKTTVVTENGQTVVIAGLMDDVAEKTKRKIPVLGDIPILGFLFSTTQDSMKKSNMLIFITPHVIKDRTDFTAILKRKIEERNNFIDTNFSKSKREKIRDTIKTHREDLLEFRQTLDVEPGVTETGEKVISIEKAPGKAGQPVITGPGISSRETSLPTTPAIESSTWKPVEPPSLYQPPPVAPKTPAESSIKSAPAPTPVPTPAPVITPTPAPEPVTPKVYKKPVVPTPAFGEEQKPTSSTTPAWLPSAKETQPVITAPKETEEKASKKPVSSEPAASGKEESKTWKKPAPESRSNGEVDLAY